MEDKIFRIAVRIAWLSVIAGSAFCVFAYGISLLK